MRSRLPGLLALCAAGAASVATSQIHYPLRAHATLQPVELTQGHRREGRVVKLVAAPGHSLQRGGFAFADFATTLTSDAGLSPIAQVHITVQAEGDPTVQALDRDIASASEVRLTAAPFQSTNTHEREVTIAFERGDDAGGALRVDWQLEAEADSDNRDEADGGLLIEESAQ